MRLSLKTAAQRVALLSALLYVAALSARVFPGHAGAELLRFGWREMLSWRSADPRVAFAWLANPLLLAALICSCLAAWRAAAALAALALALASAVSFGSRLIVSAQGAPLPMPQLGPGYWLWLASLAAALLAALLGSRAEAAAAATRGLAAAHRD